jgi:DNA-directed RNA polymerase subunit RPC12/RpoP
MMPGENCWEFMRCGRERPNVMGICPAAAEARADGVNGGRNAGRVCWAVAGTFCGGKIQGTYAQKLVACTECEFRAMVRDQTVYRFRAVYI